MTDRGTGVRGPASAGRSAARARAALALRLAGSLSALLALRWPIPVVTSSVRGESTIDATLAALLASFALGIVGLPGYLAALWGTRVANDGSRAWWIRAGLAATLAACVATGVWIVISVREIGTTLRVATIVQYLVPLGVTAGAAIALRIRVSRVTES